MIPNNELQKIVALALKEDMAINDITSKALFPKNERRQAVIVAGEKGIVCGLKIGGMVFKAMDPHCRIHFFARDGQRIEVNQKILSVYGNLIQLLAGERTALNFLQHLSGIATLARKFVDAVKGTKAKIYDTRKTIPGLRALQKYAVRCGGGTNHRMNLQEMAMVKDNHLKALRGHESWVMSFKGKIPKGIKLEVEAKNLKEVELALKARADIILLDNMAFPQLKKAIAFIRSYSRLTTHNSRPSIEVSGGVTLQNVRKIAKLGVDRISVGSLTHSAPALDMSMEIIMEK